MAQTFHEQFDARLKVARRGMLRLSVHDLPQAPGMAATRESIQVDGYVGLTAGIRLRTLGPVTVTD